MNGNRHIGIEGGIKIFTDRKSVYTDYPTAKKWVKSLFSLSENNKDKKKLTFQYTCTFGMPTDTRDLKEYMDDATYAASLHYDERIKHELSKADIRLHVSYEGMSINGKMPKGIIPEKVMSMICEVVKVRMLVEYEIHGDEEIKLSIPKLDETKVDINLINKELNAVREQIGEIEPLDIDTILDKITKYGMNSITQSELEFLNQQSRRL